jgi:nucleoside permease NupC
MNKILLIFIVGVIETFIYTAWCLSANRKEINKSSILMFIYMTVYLVIISFALMDKILLLVYALSCGVGNYLELLWEKRYEKKTK